MSPSRPVLILCLLCLMPSPAAAWGNAGHHIIARVALEYLTPKAKEAIAALLGKEDIVSVSTYADEVRSLRPETSAWHFVDMPRNAQAFVPTRDCVTTSRGYCIVTAIETLESILLSLDGKTTDEERRDALKFLVHLVGDLHQPLHCGYKDDAGGNRIRVTFFGTLTSLHAVWDTRMIEYTRQVADKASPGADPHAIKRLIKLLDPRISVLMAQGESQKAKQLLRQLYPDRMEKEGFGEWAFESYQFAVKAVDDACNPVTQRAATQQKIKKPAPKSAPGGKPGPSDQKSVNHSARAEECLERSTEKPLTLGAAYYNAQLNVMDQQLLWAGVRLALILNEIFK
jgi:hypothetical protein